jgi:hypothetical protein
MEAILHRIYIVFVESTLFRPSTPRQPFSFVIKK